MRGEEGRSESILKFGPKRVTHFDRNEESVDYKTT